MTSPKELQELSNGLSDEDYNRIRFRNDQYENAETDIMARMKAQDVHSEQEIAEMRSRYDSVEKRLLGHGIEFKINTFHEFEIATMQINKIEQDLLL